MTTIVGLDGSRAAALVAQHAISRPQFQKHCLSLITQAAQNGEVPTRMVAFLTDIIRFHEQKPQLFGLVCDWNEQGELSYGAIIVQAHVNERRALVGLNSIEEDLAKHQREVRNEGGKPPGDSKTYQKSKTQWAKKVGWL